MPRYIQILGCSRVRDPLTILNYRVESLPKTLPSLCSHQIVFDLLESFCVYGNEVDLRLAAQCQNNGSVARKLHRSRINPTARYVDQLVLGQLSGKIREFPYERKSEMMKRWQNMACLLGVLTLTGCSGKIVNWLEESTSFDERVQQMREDYTKSEPIVGSNAEQRLKWHTEWSKKFHKMLQLPQSRIPRLSTSLLGR